MKVIIPFFHVLSCIVNDTKIDWTIFNNFTPKDWEQLYVHSKKHGVVAVMMDCLKNIPKEIAPPKKIFLTWFMHSLSIEEQMKKKEKVAVEFADRLSEKGISVAVLKGLAYASYFPNPYHRESGDLDCFLMGKKEEGDKAVIEMGGRMEEAGYKHSHLYYKGLTIENHKFITNFNQTRTGVRIELLLQELIKDEYRFIENTKLLNPSADFNALFLLKHAQRHFIKEGIRVRHLLDWAFFLKAESKNVNWEKVIPMMLECRMLDFAQVMTSFCVDKLGMKIEIDGLQCSGKMPNVVLADIWGDQPDVFHENFIQKVRRICRRFYRMWKFRTLADESYLRLVWNNIAFSSYMKRNPQLS